MGCLFSADPGLDRPIASATAGIVPPGQISLTSLPVEVLQYICIICNYDNYGRDVRNFSLCCRYLRAAAIAYTFPDLTLRQYPAPSAEHVTWLLEHPDVVGRIQRLDIHHPDYMTSIFIRNARNLQRLTLTSLDYVQLSFVLILTELPNLCWLQLDRCEIGTELQEYIRIVEPGHIPAAPVLRHVRIAFPSSGTDAIEFAPWGVLTICGSSLQRLDLNMFRFACPERADWPHYTRPLRALRHLEFWSLEGDHIPQLMEFLRSSAPLALNRFDIHDPELQMDELKALIGQLKELGPSLSIVDVRLRDAALLAELQVSYPSIDFRDSH